MRKSLFSVFILGMWCWFLLSPLAMVVQASPHPSHGVMMAQENDSVSMTEQAESAGASHEAEGVLHRVMLIVFQLSLIVLAAKIGGEFTERYLKQPGVLGELVAGILISPYLFGKFIHLPMVGKIFPLPAPGSFEAANNLPIPFTVYAIAQIAAVILLFMAGLETDLQSFIKYGLASTLCAVGGVVFPLITGMWLAVIGGFAEHLLDPAAMFLGAMMVATSVGITARILTEIRKLDTPEGVTILGGAVVDDVLGILVLAIVLGVARAESNGMGIDLGAIGMTALKAVGIWLGLMAFFLTFRNPIARFLEWFRSPGAAYALAVSICLFASAVAETFGLAMIIGAYVVGLAFSATKIKHYLEESLFGIYHALVPVFFVVLGMMVDMDKMVHTWKFGIIVSLVAIVTKLFGAGLPAMAVGFNFRGAMRIGVGMIPRGEVALIVAGVGLTAGAINQEIFGLSIMMTVVTTLVAPIALVPIFQKGGTGLRNQKVIPEVAEEA